MSKTNTAGVETVDFSQPHTNLPWEKGYKDVDDTSTGADFIEQDGKVFAWSGSNCWYEYIGTMKEADAEVASHPSHHDTIQLGSRKIRIKKGTA